MGWPGSTWSAVHGSSGFGPCSHIQQVVALALTRKACSLYWVVYRVIF